jgi:hypothetical protein
MINKRIAALGCAAFLAALGTAELARAQDIIPSGKFDLVLSAGLTSMGGADVNAGLEGFANFWARQAAAAGYSVKGSFAPAHLGPDAGFDLIWRLSPTLGVGFGAGYIGAVKESAMTFAGADGGTTQTVRPSFWAETVRVGIFKTLPLSARLNLVLNGGVGFYFARARAFWNISQDSGYAEVLDSDVEKGGFGVHGGLGFEFKASQFISLLVDVSGRYARFSGFTGAGTDVVNGESMTTQGTFYYFEPLNADTGAPVYSMVSVFSEAPAGDVRVRKAKIDFSGLSLRLGIAFHL